MKIYLSLDPIDKDDVINYSKIHPKEVYDDVINIFNDDTELYISTMFTAYILNTCCLAAEVNEDLGIPKLKNVEWFQLVNGTFVNCNAYDLGDSLMGHNVFDKHMRFIMNDFYKLLNYYNK